MMKNVMMGTYIYGDETHNFNFGTDLSAADKAVFVRTVVETLVDGTNYDFILREIIFDYVTISMFTDIDTSFLKTVDDMGNVITNIDLLEDFLEETNIVEIIKANASTLFDQLNNAVDKSVEYRTGIHPSPLNDALASLLSALEKRVNEVDLNSMMSMAQKFAGMTGELTPESVVNAYINSDIHKKNLEEIAEVKALKNEIEIDEDLGKAVRAVVEDEVANNAIDFVDKK